MDDARLVALLEAIKAMALVPYPFKPSETGCDPRLVLALGQIAGLASKAIAARRAAGKAA